MVGRVKVTPKLSSQPPATVNAGEYVIVGPDGMGPVTAGTPDDKMPPFDDDVHAGDPVAAPLDKGPGLWADSRSVFQGDVTWLPVWAFQVDDVASLNAELRYDAAALRAEGSRRTGEVSNMLFEGNVREPGIVRLGWAGQRGMAGSPQVAAVGFRALGAPGQRVPGAREGHGIGRFGRRPYPPGHRGRHDPGCGQPQLVGSGRQPGPEDVGRAASPRAGIGRERRRPGHLARRRHYSPTCKPPEGTIMNANLLLAGLLAGMAGNVPVSTPEAGCQLLAPKWKFPQARKSACQSR